MDTSNPVLSGLLRKRQEIAGELEVYYGRISALTASLSSLDGAIRLFAPKTALDEIAPCPPRYNAQSGEMSRPIRDALREAGKPLTVFEITQRVMAIRQMDREDRRLVQAMQKRVMASLRILRLGGVVHAHREAGTHLKWDWPIRGR